MKIRKATKKDIPELVKIVKGNPSIEDYPGEYSAKVFKQILEDKETVIWVMMEDKKAIAFLEFKIDMAQKRIYVESILVAKSYRGKGIALMLMKELESFAKKKKYKRLSFIVRAWNGAMNKLAKKSGYKERDKFNFWEKRLK